MFDITIGILTFNSPITLENTLKSYEYVKFFDMFDDFICIIQPSDKQNLEIDVCKKYNISYEVQSTNTKMAGAINRIWELSKHSKMMFLECDFVICENTNKIKSILTHANYCLNNRSMDMVRLRSLKNPGHPIQHNLFKEHHKNKNWKNNKDILRQSNYITNYSTTPELDYPDLITKISSNPICYMMSSKYCVYTNNPHITTKTFYTEKIKPYVEFGSILEDKIDQNWHFNDYKILITEGIFKHNRLDGHTNCHCCPVEYGGSGICDSYKCCSCGLITGVKYFESQDIKESVI